MIDKLLLAQTTQVKPNSPKAQTLSTYSAPRLPPRTSETPPEIILKHLKTSLNPKPSTLNLKTKTTLKAREVLRANRRCGWRRYQGR